MLYDLIKSLYYFLFTVYLSLRYSVKDIRVHFSARIKKVSFSNHNRIYEHCVVENSILGKFTYVSASSVLNNVSVGAFTSIGPSCKIGLGIHPTDKFVSTSPIFYSTKNMFKTKFTAVNSFEEYSRIEIGNDVWVGANVIIKDGLRIGDGAIIAAGAVVTKDVSPYEIIGGVPAKHIRFRFDEGKISFLLKTNWWDFEESVLQKYFEKFQDLDSFQDFITNPQV